MKRLILDFSTRLPGPLATSLLSSDLFDVYKIEFEDFPDAFKSKDLKKVEPLFSQWYEKINSNKQILSIESIEETSPIFKKYKTIIAVGNLKKSDIAFLKKNHIHFLEIRGAKEENHKYLHDLNALLLTKSFQMNTSSQEPYLPFAGVNFAQSIRAKLLELSLRKSESWIHEKVYLKEESIKVFDQLADSDQRVNHLHNGKFPCYKFYKTKDNKTIALSCIEEHFWIKFCNVFNLNLKPLDRFNTDFAVLDQISALFLQYNGQDLQDIVDTNKLLMTIY